jgi:enolase-phosphatase E1
MSRFIVDAIVTDIEGTTSSIAFVHDVLFPYAHAHLPAFVAKHARQAAPILDEVRWLEKDNSLSDDAVVAILLQWIEEDRKITPLKTLQGMIWAEGYKAGALQGHIYPDAAAALRRWREAGLALYVYSSGSVAAQKLIFGHTAFGDLTPLFSGYFDTTTGPKLEAASYSKIAAEIGAPPQRILFLSDHKGEIDAARRAQLRTILVDRESGAPGAAASFDAITLEQAA